MFASNISLVGNHPKFLKAKDLAQNVAVTKAPVLIVGEPGTGKKTFASFIHANSARNEGAFNVVNCASGSQEVENQVLGYRDEETGSFNKGVLERSNQGTVVLENIDALEDKFQKRLFNILQELADYDLDVRVVATTSKNLSKYVGAGRFYRALYTYFSGSQVNLTPLRERGADIETLATHFVNTWASENGKEIPVFTEEAKMKISSFYWAHNVNELKAVMENTVANLEGNSIDVNAIELGEKKAEVTSNEADDDGLKLMSLKEAERLLIKKALIHTSENRTQAAKILGVSIRTLRNKINEYRGNGNNYFVNLR
ncbi:MAG: sigma 54-interacting transcriptional regulator [Bacteriovoracaceae bacterium]|jgi:two-component system response regulator FlrC|nr:sigma 54-interacting transcriptional regulator [Bacteriovoracaceae bacterium]